MLLAQPVYAEQAIESSTDVGEADDLSEWDSPNPLSTSEIEIPPPTRNVKLDFVELSSGHPLRLSGRHSWSELRFGVRSDEVVTQAVLNIKYTPSPVLIRALSHVKIYINDDVVGILDIPDDHQGGPIRRRVMIDPNLITSYNRINLQFIGHYTDRCQDPLHSSMWLDISSKSSLFLTLQRLKVRNELENFPRPFFDSHDFSQLTLPFVLPQRAQQEGLHSAGVLASYFGAQADWRGSLFPVHIDELPENHAIVLATNDQRPGFLKSYLKVEKPTIQIISNPINDAFKLLLIVGKDWQEVASAVNGLVIGNAVMSGYRATINSVELEPREPYDAPRWIRTDRPIKFGELVNDLSELQVKGYEPPPIKLNMRLPPDLFIWRSNGVPIDLIYRYTPPSLLDESRLSTTINGQFVRSFALDESGEGGEPRRLRVPIIKQWLFGPDTDLVIPAFKLGVKNQMQFKFVFNRNDRGACRGDLIDSNVAAIDSDSTIDFTDFPHYAVMPNLSAFAYAGYPFTRMADLSESAVMLSASPKKEEVYAYLNIMGRIGATTGYPATQHLLAAHDNLEAVSDKDLLYVGVIPSTIMNKSGGGKTDKGGEEVNLPLLIQHSKRLFTTSTQATQNSLSGHEFELEHDDVPKSVLEIESRGMLGALMGSESPLSEGRSMVSLMASDYKALATVSERFNDHGLVAHMRGSLVVFRSNTVESFTIGDTYAIGKLPTMSLVWYHLSQYPLLMAVVAMFAVFIITLVLWQLLRSIAARRLEVSR